MSAAVLAAYGAFGLVLFILSAGINWLLVRHMKILDVPNHRSSHSAPTPKSGGLGIVAAFLAGVVAIDFWPDTLVIARDLYLAFTASCLLVAGVSLYDDITGKPFHVKLLTQLAAACVLLWTGVLVDRVPLPGAGDVSLGWVAYPLTCLWILGLTNTFNFMDGLDGLAAGTAVVVAAAFAVVTFMQGSSFVYLCCYILAAGSLGFLVFNYPPARIFMGDVGSAFLGFSFATLAVIAFRYDSSHTSFFVMPLLLLNFIWDTAFTFFRRWRRGENLVAAHRGHLYQLLNQSGFSHRAVTLLHWTVAAAQGLGAVALIHIPGGARLLVFVPFLVFQLGYTVLVMRRARAAGLL